MTLPLTLQALVKNGTTDLSQWQRSRLASYLKEREGEYVTISVRQMGKPRSLRQNAYMWGVVYQIIADETGHTTEEVHEFMKMKFLPRQHVEIAGEEYSITKSTTKLSTDEMESFLEQVRAFAAQELSVTIPLPGECI